MDLVTPLIVVGAFWLGRWMGYRHGHAAGEEAEYIRWRLIEDKRQIKEAERTVRISATWQGETQQLFDGPLVPWRDVSDR